MKTPIALRVSDADYCKRIKDPFDSNLHHLETLLPFSEVNKLVSGNANVRTPKESSNPYKKMVVTVEKNPRAFHVKNRGITFICAAFDLSPNSAGVRHLNIHLENDSESDFIDQEITDARKVGIADGGHTFAVISNTIERFEELKKLEDWTEPFVRVRFMTSKAAYVVAEDMVEALNTSTQVKEHTMDEYRKEFQPLKDILTKSGFDISNISFKENDPGTWDVRVILQRLGCFLKDKPALGPQLYRSRQKALKMYIDPKTGKLFWIVDWKEAFKRTADELYRALTTNLATVTTVSSLGSDPAYWTTAANVILRIKSEMLQERLLTTPR